MFKYNFPPADAKALERYEQPEPRSAMLTAMNDVLDGVKDANDAIIGGSPVVIVYALMQLLHIAETALRIACRFYVSDLKSTHKQVVKACSDKGWYEADAALADYIEEGR